MKPVMRSTNIHEETLRVEFAVKAAKHFAKNPEHSTFGDIGPDNWLAIRWGLGNDCVLVIKQHETEVPVNYHQIIQKA